MIFIDSDAFIAINYEADAHFQNATTIFNRLKQSSEILVTSWDVVSEVATKLSYFTTKQIALGFIKTVYESNIRIEYVHPILAISVLDFHKKQTSKRVSVTDCVNMVIAKELGIKRIFSFDQHYPKNGFELLK
jgi:predicted nucleic acid-binding protein